MRSYQPLIVFEWLLGILFALISLACLSQPMSAVWVFWAVLSVLAFGLAGWKGKQGPSLVIDSESVMVREHFWTKPVRFSWSELAKIDYRIVPRGRYGTARTLRFIGKRGECLAESRLDHLQEADFNDIHGLISPRLPHLIWEFPE